MQNHKLTVSNLRVTIEGKEILHGISLTVKSGQVHVLMGPNGSGKSTLAATLMGNPNYKITCGKLVRLIKEKPDVTIDGRSIVDKSSEERARAGLFLAFQAPIAIPGVSVINLLRTAYQELHGSTSSPQVQKKRAIQNPLLARRWQATDLTLTEFADQVKKYAKQLNLDESLLSRGIHDGFSGGEKKKIEMLQALVLKPKFAIFDEIDTGLDVDALKIVAGGINNLRQKGVGLILITHYQRILKYLKPDVIHVMVRGRIVATGKALLAQEIEENGYKKYTIH